MNNGLNPGVIAMFAMLAYLALIGGIIYLLVRRRRRQMAERGALIAQALEAAGARHVGAAPAGGIYRGTEHEYDLGGGRVFTNTYSVNRYYYRVNLRVASDPLPWVTVYAEGAVQRFGKAIGLNREIQTGDQAFDDAAYIDTIEVDAPVQRVFEGAAVREGVLGLLQLGYKVMLSEKGLEAFRLFSHGTDPDVSAMGEAAALLAKIKGGLPRLERESFRGKISFLTARALFVLLGWVPFIILAGALDGVMHSPGARTLNAGGKGTIVLFAALTAWVLYVALVALRLRGRSYALPVLALMAFFGLLGIPAGGVIAVLSINQGLDGSPGELRVVEVTRVSKYKGECRIVVSSWLRPGTTERFPIPCKHLAHFEPGISVQLREHPGALGMPWIDPIRASE
jgi:hypothetical protein